MDRSKPIVNETDLIQKARSGNEAAWEKLVGAHQEGVFRFAYLSLGDPDEAADVAQETFLRAFRALDGFDAARPLRPWLLQIAKNLAHNRRRSLARYWKSLKRKALSEPPSNGNLEARTAAELESRTLWMAIRALPPHDQAVIYLRYFLELPVDETAETLEIAPGTVKSRLSRAITRLRGVIERDFPELTDG